MPDAGIGHGLVYLYGPPAVGKLTIGELLCERTGWPLFHNHLTIDAIRPIFEFGSPPFIKVLHRFRLDVIETAMAEGSSLVFTNSSVWDGADGRQRFAAFAESVRCAAARGGATTTFVQLTAPVVVLEQRLDGARRQHLGKLVDPGRLHKLMAGRDHAALHADDLTIDTSACSADAAAKAIHAHIVGSAGR